ncbi:MAG: cysteine-S-conjugate beta-lyase [Candidatus Sumerlaeota bacterium]|nr:cysteine-S-conjugate beta-lyase [Candidatus Sumerlaeota bacterium]
MGFRTDAIQKGVYADKTFNSVTTPVYMSTTYFFDGIGQPPRYDYSRSGNPTRAALEENLAALENGAGASYQCTGMAAVTTALFLFKPGDHIITGREIYGGTYRLFSAVFAQRGIEFSFVDMTKPEDIRAAVKKNTRGIWIETPSNPQLRLTDIAAVVSIAREHGILTLADNTFMSPYFQRPLDLGVDFVVHSTTKYINGHSDVVGGCVISRTAENAKTIAEITNNIGTPGSPFDAFLVLRGVKTLPFRMKAHQENALAIAEFLASHPRVKNVSYPGLPSHPQHELAKQQMSGFGGMLSFRLDLDKIDPNKFVTSLDVLLLAESLGGVESLICQPWSMTHLSMPEEARRAADIDESMFRISAGLEDPEDLIADLKQALEA